MSEEDVREGLRGAVATEPSLSFDPDALMDIAQRQTKRRRALVAVAVATTAIAAVAVAVPVVLGTSRGTDGVAVGAAPPASSAAPPAPSDIPWPPPGVEPVHYTAAQLTQRGEDMRAHLSGTFATMVPGASSVEVQPFGGEAAGDVSDGQDYLNAFVEFAEDGVPYAVDVQAIAPGAETTSPEERCEADQSACEVRRQQDGSWLLIANESEGQSQIVSVIHYRDTGAVVRATGYNYDPTSPTAVTYSPAIPATVDQLAELATDPELGL